MTFETFLREAIAKGGEVWLVPRAKVLTLIEGEPLSQPPTAVEFYAHVVNVQGSFTVDFSVFGNSLVALHNDPAVHAAAPPAAAGPALHASGCATHNAPAMEPGPCDCGAA